MKLDRYLHDTKVSQSSFAVLIGKTQAAVNRYVKGHRVPDHATIERIHAATGGKVSWPDWHPEMVRAIRKRERAA